MEYIESVDALLDGFHVPTTWDGKTLWLRDRVLLLAEKANERSRLAYDLFTRLDKELGNAFRNGYFPEEKPLWERARAEFGIKG